MYAATPDPYCYPGSTVLKNRLDLRTQEELDAFEAAMFTQRLDEPLPAGRLSYCHYRALHRHLFGDVYAWAGRLRTVRISKGNSMFCYPEFIDGHMRRLFADLRSQNYFRKLDRPGFAKKAAFFLAEVNAIHPFREGNGRTQLTFLAIMGHAAQHEIHYDDMDSTRIKEALIESFGENEHPLACLIAELSCSPKPKSR